MIFEAKQARGGYQCLFHLGRLGEFSGYGEALYRAFAELADDEWLVDAIERSVADVDGWKTKTFESLFDFRLYRILLYALVRARKPSLMIETGVLHGMTSAFILRAIERNGHGRLISIDLPSTAEEGPSNKDGYFATLPQGKGPGWIVPEALSRNWELRLESSTVALPNLEVPDLDIFLHDSEHIFETMWFELDWAWERLRPGGILICDNIEASTAFHDLGRRYGRECMLFPAPDRDEQESPRFGLMLKGRS
jgi:hypothetical protein